MSQGINIRSDIYTKWKEERNGKSFSEWIDTLIQGNQNLQEATISQSGQLSKTLAGKTILYRLKDPDGVITKEIHEPETLGSNTNP